MSAPNQLYDITLEYIDPLVEELNKIIEMYHKRITDLREQSVSLGDTLEVTAGCATFGMVLGSVIPVAGNLIGGVIGAVIGASSAKGLKTYRNHNTQKLHHAKAVINYLGENQEIIIKQAAQRVIQERKEILQALQNSREKTKLITRYLAVNMIAAIKHSAHNPSDSITAKIDVMVNGVKNTKSKKERSRQLQSSASVITLKLIAQGKPLVKSQNLSSQIAPLPAIPSRSSVRQPSFSLSRAPAEPASPCAPAAKPLALKFH